MPLHSYSFLDVVALDGVREHFLAGRPAIVLAPDLATILWANGPGAALMGFADVETAAGSPVELPPVAKRQILAGSRFAAPGMERPVSVRLTARLPSRVLTMLARKVVMPDGKDALLLASIEDPSDAAAALDGFSTPHHHAAIVDRKGHVRLASDGFSAIGLSEAALAGLAGSTGAARVAKRVIEAEGRSVPAGVARLLDNPERYLLLVVDEEMAADDAVWDGVAQPLVLTEDERETRAESHDGPEVQAAALDGDEPSILPPEDAVSDQNDLSVASYMPLDSSADGSALAERNLQPPDIAEASAVADTTPAPEAEPSAVDAELAGDATAVSDEAAIGEQPAPKWPMPLLRFVWRSDEAGRIQSISPEFLDAMQIHEDLVGERFADAAARIGFDLENEVAGLLARRDTWSGRTVLWPVPEAGVRVPVDLAALPAYSRTRAFKGFRGFGVARFVDAVDSPELIQLAASQISVEPETDTTSWPEAPAAETDERPSEQDSGGLIRTLSSIEKTAFREIGERLRGSAEAIDRRRPEKWDAANDAAPIGQSNSLDEPAAGLASPALDDSNGQPDFLNADAVAEGSPSAVVDEFADAEAPNDELHAGDDVAHEAETIEVPVRRPDAPDTGVADAVEPSDEPSQVTWDQADTSAAVQSSSVTLEELAEPVDTDEPSPAPDVSVGELALLRRLPVPVLIHRGDELLFANDGFFELTGYRDLDALAEAGGMGEVFADDPDLDVAHDERPLAFRTSAGTVVPIQATLRSVPWGDGKALMLVVKRIETSESPATPKPDSEAAELRDRLSEMRAIIDTATDGVILIERDGSIRSISRAAEALLGFESNDVAGRPFISLFAMESQRLARDYLAGLADNGVASVLNDGREVIGRESQGRFIPLFMTIGKLPDDNGYCAVVRDITQWKRAEEDLTQARSLAERASSQKTDFLARVSHEIRTPLNAIIGFSELMMEERFGPVGNDRYRDYLRDVNRSGNHVLAIVNDLLDISKIEAGEHEMTYEAVSLNDSLVETVAMMQPQANRERVIIRSSYASRLPEVVADRRSVRQIALNLLSNAVRYTQAGGQVIVSTAHERSGEVVLRVRDTGIGMSTGEIEQALKPFKRINALRRPRGDGTGLGLPLTKAMVEANRARFSIVSTPGEGTLVEIIFPSTRVLAD